MENKINDSIKNYARNPNGGRGVGVISCLFFCMALLSVAVLTFSGQHGFQMTGWPGTAGTFGGWTR